MARGQMQADNILKETLQHYRLTSTDSNVYSNQCNNRWRGMSLWQADVSLRFLMPQSRGTDSIKAFPHNKDFYLQQRKNSAAWMCQNSHAHTNLSLLIWTKYLPYLSSCFFLACIASGCACCLINVDHICDLFPDVESAFQEFTQLKSANNTQTLAGT